VTQTNDRLEQFKKMAADDPNNELGHFSLGRAYLDAGPTHAAEALKELTQCVNRRGEVTDVFLANTPSVRYLPPMYYWLARAQEAVGSSAEAKKTYNEFLTRRPAPDTTDNLVTDARRRAK